MRWRRNSLPSTITEIKESAFVYCEALKTVHFAGSEAEWNAITVAEGNELLLAAEIVFGK